MGKSWKIYSIYSLQTILHLHKKSMWLYGCHNKFQFRIYLVNDEYWTLVWIRLISCIFFFSASRIRLRLKLYAHKLFFTLRCYQEIYNLQMRNLLFSSMATLALRSYLNILKFSSMLGHEFGILKCSHGILEFILIIRYLRFAICMYVYIVIYFFFLFV